LNSSTLKNIWKTTSMDLFLGIILGVVGYSMVLKLQEYKVQKNKPRRGRPPKRINIDDTPEDHR